MLAVCGDKVELAAFSSLPELTTAVGNGFAPDVMFVDFFIDGDYGTDVITFLRKHFGDKVFIIAHSSMDQANSGMVERGADVGLSKIKGSYPSKTVINELKNYENFLLYIERTKSSLPGDSEGVL